MLAYSVRCVFERHGVTRGRLQAGEGGVLGGGGPPGGPALGGDGVVVQRVDLPQTECLMQGWWARW